MNESPSTLSTEKTLSDEASNIQNDQGGFDASNLPSSTVSTSRHTKGILFLFLAIFVLVVGIGICDYLFFLLPKQYKTTTLTSENGQSYEAGSIMVQFKTGVSRSDAEEVLNEYKLKFDAINVTAYGGTKACLIRGNTTAEADPRKIEKLVNSTGLFLYPLIYPLPSPVTNASLGHALYGDGIRLELLRSTDGDKVQEFDAKSPEVTIICDAEQAGRLTFNRVYVANGREEYWVDKISKESSVESASLHQYPNGG